MKTAIRTGWLIVGLVLILVGAAPVAAAGPTWQHWRTISGIFDIAGPREDGKLVVAGSGLLYLVDTVGNVSPFARGPKATRMTPAPKLI